MNINSEAIRFWQETAAFWAEFAAKFRRDQRLSAWYRNVYASECEQQASKALEMAGMYKQGVYL